VCSSSSAPPSADTNGRKWWIEMVKGDSREKEIVDCAVEEWRETSDVQDRPHM
jgi:hypothetical protein